MKGEIVDNNKKNNKLNLENLTSKDASDVIKAMIDSKKEYETTKEVERTKRLAIEKVTEIHLEKIRANKETVENISKAVFNERSKVIDKNFEVLEKALDEDKDAVAVEAMKGISEIVKESPLKDFDSISNALQNDDVDFTL